MLAQSDIRYLEECLPFWNKLSPSEKESIIQNTLTVKYKKGQNVHSADNDCVGVLIVKSGELRAYILSEEGKEITLYRLAKGNICVFSASCVIKTITFDVVVDCTEDAEAYLLNISVFQRLCESNVYVENFSLKLMTERFSDVMWTMEQILFMSFEKRLAVFMLDEVAKSGSMEIMLTHEQIAKYIGSAREVVSRMLKNFEKEGIVKLSRGSVKVLDRSRLRKII